MSEIRKSLTNLSPTQIFFNNSLLLLERTNKKVLKKDTFSSLVILKFSFHSESTTPLNYQMDVLPGLTQNIGLFRCIYFFFLSQLM